MENVRKKSIDHLIDRMPLNCDRKNNVITMANGFSVRFRFNSDSFSIIVGNGWVHFTFCLIQLLHDFERSLCRCRSWNSWVTASLDTQPRNQQSDFSASAVRFFDNNHCGVSGIKQMAIAVMIGTEKHTAHALRHGINVFSRYTRNMPIVPQMNVYPIKTPRTDGSLYRINETITKIDYHINGHDWRWLN